jgi:hypothetical protein
MMESLKTRYSYEIPNTHYQIMASIVGVFAAVALLGGLGKVTPETRSVLHIAGLASLLLSRWMFVVSLRNVRML